MQSIGRPRLLPRFRFSFGLVAFAVYLRTLAPGVTLEDSGELITAAALLGVPHPPGFPAWVLLTHSVMALTPLPVALAANLVSALCGACAAVGVLRLSRCLGASAGPAAAAALLLAFGRTFWSQSIIAEVYTLNAAFLAFALWALVAWGQGRGERWLHGAALLFGFGLANHHPLTLLAGPPCVLYVLVRWKQCSLRPRALALSLAALLLPLLLYAYLPWAASRGPAVNWGEPSTLDAFWAHLTHPTLKRVGLSEHFSQARFVGSRGFRVHLRPENHSNTT